MPFIGIAFFDWSLFNFLFLYWLESAVIGFYFILKMIRAAKFRGGSYGAMLVAQSIFFVFHFGGFMAGHLFFIYFVSQQYQTAFNFTWTGLIFLLFNIVSLFISHGISYRDNFIKGREYERLVGFLLFEGPYSRLFVMQLVVIIGAIFMGRAPYLIVILKLAIDYWAHAREHKIKENLEPANKIFAQLGEDLNSGKVAAMSNEEYTKLLAERFNKISEDKK